MSIQPVSLFVTPEGKTKIAFQSEPEKFIIVPHAVTTLVDSLLAYERGALMQEAFPYLTPDEREFLMTGLTPEEWEEIFPPENPDTSLTDPTDPDEEQ